MADTTQPTDSEVLRQMQALLMNDRTRTITVEYNGASGYWVGLERFGYPVKYINADSLTDALALMLAQAKEPLSEAEREMVRMFGERPPEKVVEPIVDRLGVDKP